MSILSRVKAAGRVLFGKPPYTENPETPKDPPTPQEVYEHNPPVGANDNPAKVSGVHTPSVLDATDNPPPLDATLPRTQSTPTVSPTMHKPPKTLAPRSLPVDATNYPALKEFNDQHREHQAAAIAACANQTIGQISIPTGTGKTRIQIHLHLMDMVEMAEQGSCGVYVIAAHRLALCRQLLYDLVDKVVACKLPFDILLVGSDNVEEGRLYEKYMKDNINKTNTYATATTVSAEIKEAAILAEKEKRNLLVVSTYHSLDRLKVLDRVNVLTYDEAHTITSSRQSDDNFEAHVRTLQDTGIIQRQFFFTATRKISGEEYGMNNKEIYGEVLYGESPRKMIQAGEIVPPRIHKVNPVGDGDFNNGSMLMKTILDAFSRHRKEVREATPLSKNTIGAKLLVTLDGSEALDKLRTNNDFKAWFLVHKVKLFMFSSLYGNFKFSKGGIFEKVTRNDAILDMQEMPLSQDAIFIHIDILTEGIDLPAITGVMPFRELNLIKLLQTIGRGARLVPGDRNALYSGTIQPMEYNKMIKPYCWVLLPLLDTSSEGSVAKMEDTIKRVREAYEVPAMEFSREDEFMGAPDPELPFITPRDEGASKDPITDLVHTLEEIMVDPTSCQHTRQSITAQLAAVIDPALKL